jgi:regulation of enolase protein 1 (concanavalin A-like superfamily)
VSGVGCLSESANGESVDSDLDPGADGRGLRHRDPAALCLEAGEIVLSEDRDRTVFGVTYADLPENLIQDGNRDAALDGSCSGMIAASGATLLEKRNVSFGEYPGREIRFDVHPAGMSEKGIGVARIYLVGPRIYQLLALGGESKFQEASAKTFFESFRLDDGLAPAKSSVPTLASAIETGWGTPEDPGGDCRIQVEGSAATIEVPATLRVLEPGGKDNTPKLVKPIEGDFIADVKVVGNDVPVDPPAEGSKVAFIGAGLILRTETGEIVRLERAAYVRDGRLRTYILFEQHRAGQSVVNQETDYPGGPVTLRLERHGDQVFGSFSLNATDWRPFDPKPVTGKGGSVGVAAINTTSYPFLAMFEGMEVKQP